MELKNWLVQWNVEGDEELGKPQESVVQALSSIEAAVQVARNLRVLRPGHPNLIFQLQLLEITEINKDILPGVSLVSDKDIAWEVISAMKFEGYDFVILKKL